MDGIDTTHAHSARIYDYLLGGKDWFAADKKAAERLLSLGPTARIGARANRAFMHRATRVLAREFGIRQFLDLGTGIPTKPNLHQVAQETAPDSHVVYVDNDPLVVEYASALMNGTPEGTTTYIEADVRTEDVLTDPRVADTLDLSEPVAVSMVALLHFLTDDQATTLVRRTVGSLAPGSFLVLAHSTSDFVGPEAVETFNSAYGEGTATPALRSRPEIDPFFDGLELLAPGLVVAHRWRDEELSDLPDEQVSVYAGVARKP